MAQKFCTQCGSALGDGQRFCSDCGARIEAFENPDDQVTELVEPVAGASGYADTSGLDRFVSPDPIPAADADTVQSAPVPAAAPPVYPTTQMPAVGAPAKSYYEQPPASYSAPAATAQRSDGRIVIALVAAVIIIGVAVALALLQPWNQSTDSRKQQEPSSSVASSSVATESSSESSSDTPSSSASSSSSSASSSSSGSESSTSEDDAKVLEVLTAAYEQMGDFDDRISSVAADFNSTWASSDSDARRANADEAKQLQREIESALSDIESVQSAAKEGKYASDYRNMVQLQEDLDHRISVIVEAWDNALASKNPKANEKSVLAPLARDNDSSGKNKYKKDFDALYPNARPGE